MYSIVYTNQFKKSLKRCVKRGLDVSLLTAAVTILGTVTFLNNSIIIPTRKLPRAT